MKFQLYDNVNHYFDDVMEYLAAHEIQSNMIIANCLRAKNGMDSSNWFFGSVKNSEGELQLAALMTPPFNLVIYEGYPADDEVIDLLANEIVAMGVPIPGVLAEKSLAGRFADRYSQISGRIMKNTKNMRVYRLDKVNELSRSPGLMRPAAPEELYYLPYWNIGFSVDCGFGSPSMADSLERTKKLIDDKLLYVWEDGFPVSQAAIGRKTFNGAVVSAVYTPPHLRGKGYATSCVATLSKLALETGNKFCCLYTDLANPISNGIYMKMGYKPMCNNDEYKFEDQPE